ncbi:hypothetical protein C8R45DRAFT_1218299 [Mycena sanguinolenta]|nr:hypothetical protein C8R45DRAFT_1218299 [Mycena sanguinolenta]
MDTNPDWESLLSQISPTPDLQNPEIQCQILFSLLIFFGLSIQQFLVFLFESSIAPVKHRAGLFMRYHPAHGFAPERIFKAWHDHFPKSVPHLHSKIIKPCMDEIALAESDAVINDPRLKVRLKDCTVEHICNVLNPGILPSIYTEDAPYAWGFLTTFTTSPNEYRKKRERKSQKARATMPTEADEWEETANSLDDGAAFVGETGFIWRDMGFARNATFYYGFPMILGLFLEIGGTSSRILNTLSNAGACVSITTIERLKKILSEDAVAHAVKLVQGPKPFYIIFDNINIFLRKSQQRLFNKNTMIHATNAAVVALPDADPIAENLEAKQKRRGKRAAATGADILPTDDDEAKMFSSFVGLTMLLILAYCPGSKEWEGRDVILKAAEDMIASDRPLPPKRTDGRPAGVFDVNEGSKKGIIQMLKKLQEFSGFTESEWAGKARIIVGDWLTSSNIRAAPRDRMDDINDMERLAYVEELSALWHFALNATHMIMHKGLLNRTWDAEKPNYAAAKALIRHSLIARILYEVMLKKNIK